MRAAHLLAVIACAVAVDLALAADPAAAPPHAHETMAPAQTIAGESIYQLDLDLTTADGRQRPLAQLRGRPVLITMFYASCDGVCPLLAFNLQRMEKTLTPAERARVQVVMVSFDPQRDTPAALTRFAELHRIDTGRWWLARASEDEVRELAAVLGIRYRETQPGIFSHSAVVTLLDAGGVIVERTANLQTLEPGFQQALRRTLTQP